ncbi:MAG: hypothetical protein IJD99_11675 [Clostridia bacterium]|nr:hypothetical protein [Clostridia bacterium]
MRRMISLIFLACLLTVSAALGEDALWPQPYTGDMAGTWGFAGGAEEHGDGFRLNPDGTGVCLEIIDYEQVPPQYRELEYTFTWRVERTSEKTYLHETYADGRQVTCEIETWGDARIHIPNHISGGFYYPVLDSEARAYLAGKAEHSAFDGVMMNYLDGSITGKIEAATGLRVGEIHLQKEQGAWQIVFGVWDDARDMEVRFLLREDEWRVSASDAGWLWGDFDLGQSWPAARDGEDPYARLPGILESYLTWEVLPQPTKEPQPTEEPQPQAPVIPELTAQLGTFTRKQRYAVYEAIVGGDDVPNPRAGNGKAVVSTNGDIEVYALWKGHLLIGYAINDDRHRIGWIDGAIPVTTQEDIPELPYNRLPEENVYGVVHESAVLTDDPLYSQSSIVTMKRGTSVHVLARLDEWYLVQGYVGNDLRMGFLHQDKVDLDHGYAADPEWTIGLNTRYTERDVQDAFDALAQCIYQNWPGTGLAAVRYDEDDADEAYSGNPWWTDDTGTKEGILLLADLSSMELHDYEIAGTYAKDYLFILYREPGGEWVVANWGYT